MVKTGNGDPDKSLESWTWNTACSTYIVQEASMHQLFI